MLANSFAILVASVLCFSSVSSSLNIIVSNDDGFASANIREFYRLLNAAGHNAWIVAPVMDNSGQGGRAVFTTEANLTSAGEFDSVPSGAPSFGTDANDSHIWYYNGTPAACVFFALDYVVPNYWNGTKPDLLVSGPNFGNNAGPWLFTTSGTIGATYSAIERGIPGIAFSAGNGGQRGYKSIVSSTKSGYPDPATIAGNLSTQIVNQLQANSKGSPILPTGYGVSVNYPDITSLTDTSCVSPPFIQTRITGGASVDTAVYDASTGLFSSGSTSGANTCINGDCSLPGESTILSKCESSVSVFTVDYDAPTGDGTQSIRQLLQPLVTAPNSTSSSTKSTRSVKAASAAIVIS